MLPFTNQKERILIGSCGGLTGVYLAQTFKKIPQIEVWGTDVAFENPGRHFVDCFSCLPAASDACFLDELINFLNRQEITYYIPTHSKEIYQVSKYEREIRARTDAQFIVCPFETFCLLNDKKSANMSMKKWGIPTPQLYGVSDRIKGPVFMKRITGSGGAGSFLIEDERVYEVLRKCLSDVVFFEYLQGPEYTVDCMFDTQGTLLAWNQRLRVKTIGGAVSITKNEEKIDIKPWIQKFQEHCVFRGCVNFQYILVNNIPYFIDINLRYPSGGLPLSVESGVNVPEILIKLLRNEPIEKKEYMSDKRKRVMYRYFKEFFEEYV